MKADIREYVRQCIVYQKNQVLDGSSSGLLQPVLCQHGWDEVAMDVIEGFPKSEGMDTILVVVDRSVDRICLICRI